MSNIKRASEFSITNTIFLSGIDALAKMNSSVDAKKFDSSL